MVWWREEDNRWETLGVCVCVLEREREREGVGGARVRLCGVNLHKMSVDIKFYAHGRERGSVYFMVLWLICYHFHC